MMRLRTLAAGVTAVALLCGFVPFTEKILEKCRRATPVVRRALPVTLDGKPGRLMVGVPGGHALLFDDGARLTDPGLEALAPAGEGEPSSARAPERFLALWRFLDFYSPSRPDDFTELLTPCAIDLNRRGLVRADESGDRIAVTIGAFGESEADFPQAWIDRDTGHLLRLALPDNSSAELAGVDSEGLPEVVILDKGASTLRILRQDGPRKSR